MPRKITQIGLAELVEDMEIYPRHAVDPTNVQSLVMAIKAGAQLPPIVADRKSKRIVDGWHRGRAYRRVHGAAAVVDVELIDYASDAAMLFDAVHRNAKHGCKLASIDQTRAVVMLQRYDFSAEKIALCLNVTEDRIGRLTIRTAVAPESSRNTVPGTATVTLKRPVIHLAGQTLTESQVEAHGMLPGTSFLLVAKQLCAALREKMVDMQDTKLLDQLRLLRDVLVEVVH